MKKIILLIVLVIVTIQFTFAQNSIAKFKFEEAEEAYSVNNFELALTKLKEVEIILKSTNPKILYLQILSQIKIIEKNPLGDYAIIENTRVSIEKYLKDYDNLPDNEDKYREIYKISETFKSYPQSEIEFLTQKSNVEKSLKKEQELIEEQKRTAIERERIIAQNKIIEEEKRRKEHEEYLKNENSLSFFNLGIQSGSIGKYGIVVESIESDSRFGFRMSVRGSFISGETTQLSNKIYVPLNEKKQGRFALDLGPIIRVAHPFYLYVGIGFGTYTNWTLSKVYNQNGSLEEKYVSFDGEDDLLCLENSIGVIIKLGRVININGGFSLLNLGSPEFTFGLSFNIYSKWE